MRIVDKKRPPLMNARKWTIVIVTFLIFVAVLTTLYYRDVQMERWNEKTVVRSSLDDQYDLSTEQYLEKYIWEDQYWIFLAKNDNGQEQYVSWKDNEIAGEISTNSIILADQALQRLYQLDPNATNTNVIAGYTEGQFVWEVRYNDMESKHLKYAFFSMKDGRLLNLYTIPKGT